MGKIAQDGVILQKKITANNRKSFERNAQKKSIRSKSCKFHVDVKRRKKPRQEKFFLSESHEVMKIMLVLWISQNT
jgi:hypothetical protein